MSSSFTLPFLKYTWGQLSYDEAYCFCLGRPPFGPICNPSLSNMNIIMSNTNTIEMTLQPMVLRTPEYLEDNIAVRVMGTLHSYPHPLPVVPVSEFRMSRRLKGGLTAPGPSQNSHWKYFDLCEVSAAHTNLFHNQ